MSEKISNPANGTPVMVPPLPDTFLGLPLPEQREFRYNEYGTAYAPGTLGEALMLTAEVAEAFGAKPKLVHKISDLAHQIPAYLPYAPLAGAVLEDAYHGTETVRPVHIAPLLEKQERRVPWRVRQMLGKFGMSLGSETPAVFVHGGLNAVLTGSTEAKQALDAFAGPKVATARPYMEQYARFEGGPRQQLQAEVYTLLDAVSHNARHIVRRNRAAQGEDVSEARFAKNPDRYIDRDVVGESLQVTALAVLEGRINLPMVDSIVQDILGLIGKKRAAAMGKDPAATIAENRAVAIAQLKATDPRLFKVGAHRIVKALNAFLPEEHRFTKLEDLSGSWTGMGMAAQVLPGSIGGKFRALNKLPKIAAAAIRFVPEGNRQLAYPLEIATTLTDPARRTIALPHRAGSLAMAAAY
ncbi:MAG TPA: hypothetical protein VLE99_04720 [Candidatus Saccharimonadales bacterium]|nr:hypothetical protein [Candidatus Saccharimonadales bacterium]